MVSKLSKFNRANIDRPKRRKSSELKAGTSAAAYISEVICKYSECGKCKVSTAERCPLRKERRNI